MSGVEALKYYRLHSNTALTREKISVCTMFDPQTLAVGTESGMVYILGTDGKLLRSYKAHDCLINDISVDYYGTMACCSDNGTVVLYQLPSLGTTLADEKPTVVHCNEPVKSICVGNSMETLQKFTVLKNNREILHKNSSRNEAGAGENTASNNSNKRTEWCFVAGSATGQLSRHRISWYSQKKDILFAGAGTAVTTIAWLGDLIAWADALQVRIMDANTLTAICYLDSPSGVGTTSLPCSLCWASEHDLFVGWADSFRHLELMASADIVSQSSSVNAGLPNNSNTISGGTFARTVSDWQTDFIICGLGPFDAEHVVLLGYAPPDGVSMNGAIDEEIESENSCADNPGDKQPKPGNDVEVHIYGLFNGKAVASDRIQLMGDAVTSGPWAYKMCSNYDTIEHMGDAIQWKMNPAAVTSYSTWPPKLFIVGPQDLICAAIRDVNDNIGKALQDMDLQTAINLAAVNPSVLVKYNFADLLFLYVTKLLDGHDYELAMEESVRLIRETGPGSDGAISQTATLHLWERCVYAFSKHQCLHLLAPHLPWQRPYVLPRAVYAFILEEFFILRAEDFAKLVEKWAPVPSHLTSSTMNGSRSATSIVSEPLYNVDSILSQLNTIHSTSRWHKIAKGHLYRTRGEWDIALDHFLQSAASDIENDPAVMASSSAVSSDIDLVYDYSTVFAMIVYNDLFGSIQDKLWTVSRLDKIKACDFFVTHRDKFSIPSVVQQLRNDRKCLYFYLHELFTSVRDEYNVQDLAEYHALQVTLYAEFAPPFTRSDANGNSCTEIEEADNTMDVNKDDDSLADIDSGMKMILNNNKITGSSVSNDPDKNNNKDSVFLKFLILSDFAPLDVALTECEKQNPPLYNELVYIHTKMGNIRLALDILLREIGDVKAAIEFVETNDPQLWGALTEYCLSDGKLLGQVLDYAGISPNVSPATIISQIPPKLHLPRLRKRLLLLNNLSTFRQFVTDRCNEILADDTVTLQRSLNQLKRRAVKVDPGGARCSTCAKPVFIPTTAISSVDNNGKNVNNTTSGLNLAVKAAQQLLSATKGGIWGKPLAPSRQPSGVLVFGNKLVFHRQCYMDLMKSMEKMG